MKIQQLEKMKEHVLSIIDFSDYENMDNTATNVIDTLYNEYGHEVKRLGERKAFIEWAKGLPTCLNIYFYYDDVNQFLSDCGCRLYEDDSKSFEMYLDCIYIILLSLKSSNK